MIGWSLCLKDWWHDFTKKIIIAQITFILWNKMAERTHEEVIHIEESIDLLLWRTVTATWTLMKLFNNILVISWQSVLLVEKTWVPGENHWHVASHWQTYHIMLHRVHLAWAEFELIPFVVIATNCIYSYKSNYHMITTTTDPKMTGVVITNECTVGDLLWSYRFTRAGSVYPSGAPAFTPGFLWGSCYSI